MAPKIDSAGLYQLCTSKDHIEQKEGFELLGKILFGAARKQLNINQFDNTSVNDCIQDALVIIWTKIAAADGPNSPKAFISWSCRIVKNKCIDEVRKKGRRKTVPLDKANHDDDNGDSRVEDKDSRNPEKEALKKDKIKRLIAAVEQSSLSDNEKTVLLGGFLFEKNDDELSKLLKTTNANIKVIRHRALKKLRKDDDLRNFLGRM